jgi:hypothetical protein
VTVKPRRKKAPVSRPGLSVGRRKGGRSEHEGIICKVLGGELLWAHRQRERRSFTKILSWVSALSVTSNGTAAKQTPRSRADLVYGQAAGETVMTDWVIVSPPPRTGQGAARARLPLTPGSAQVYNEGRCALPAARWPDPTAAHRRTQSRTYLLRLLRTDLASRTSHGAAGRS